MKATGRKLVNEMIKSDRDALLRANQRLLEYLALSKGTKRKEPTKQLTDSDINKVKELVSELKITINTVFQNFGKKTFTGIGGLQRQYERLANGTRPFVYGPYDSEDKQLVLSLIKPLEKMLTELEQLVANSRKFFSPVEANIINKIKNNISTSISPIPVDVIRDGQIVKEMSSIGNPPPLNPLGEFTDVVVAEDFSKSLGPGRPKGKATATVAPDTVITKKSKEYVDLDKLINDLINGGDRDIQEDAIKLNDTLQNETKGKKNPAIKSGVFNEIKAKALKLKQDYEGKAGDDGEAEDEGEAGDEGEAEDEGGFQEYPGVFGMDEYD